MAIQNARILIRRGNEVDFDANNMQPGEWALSTDKKIVRICVAPGVCIRMATYDAFEADMAKIEAILEQAKSIKEAVTLINTEVSENAKAVAEYTEQAKQYRDEAEQFRNEAEAFAPEGYSELVQNVEENTVKIETILEKGGLTFDESASGENIHLTDTTDNKATAFALYGKATQDGTPTPDAPVEIEVAGASGSVEVVSCGKNLLKNTATSQTRNGVTFTVNEDGSITANGTSTSQTSLIIKKLYVDEISKLNGYKLSGGLSDCRLFIESNTTYTLYGQSNGNESVINVSKNENVSVFYRINSGVTINETLYPMISKEGGDYEPYKETVSTISTPNGLPGIPVSSGGNYTDENGQQWICDSIVKYADGNGQYIQRIGKATYNSSSYWGLGNITDTHTIITCTKPTNMDETITNGEYKAMCNMFTKKSTVGGMAVGGALNFFVPSTYEINSIDDWKTLLGDKNLEFYYALSEPIITDLSVEEIAEIEKLHTFYPVTNISNDADCGMEIAYKADAKNYIDNIILARVATLETAVINNL